MMAQLGSPPAAGATGPLVTSVGAATITPSVQNSFAPSLRGAEKSSFIPQQGFQVYGGAQLVAVGAISIMGMQGLAYARRRYVSKLLSSRLTRAESEGAEEAGVESLASEVGLDYSKLKELLSAGEYKEADAETRRLLIELAGTEAVKRGWVYFAEVRKMPVTDLSTIDGLWVEFSDGKFGYSKQRKFWRQCRGAFDKFAEKVSWFTGKWQNRNWPDEFIYDTSAPEGHLPLTNCIRGAQVLQELMEHPAFEKSTARKALAGGAGSSTRLTAKARAGAFTGSATSLRKGMIAGRGLHARSATVVACRAASASEAPAAVSLESLTSQNVINEHGFILPELEGLEDSAAVAFLIYDMNGKAQYLGFSKDLRNTLRTLICRRPELCYSFRAVAFEKADQDSLMAVRSKWVEELEGLPPGNADTRQKALWEKPVDSGAVSERAYKVVSVQKAKQIARQLKDRGLKEVVQFKAELFEQGKVDVMPSTRSLHELSKQQEAMSKSTASVECMVGKKLVKLEVYFASEFQSKGGWWFDVEVTANKQKSSHRVIVGNDFAAQVETEPRSIVEKCFAVLLANKVPRQTDSLITSEVFPINYFTASNVAVRFPELLDLFQKDQDDIHWDDMTWNFKQVHDYQEDAKRTIPAGPMGGYFDPNGLQ